MSFDGQYDAMTIAALMDIAERMRAEMNAANEQAQRAFESEQEMAGLLTDAQRERDEARARVAELDADVDQLRAAMRFACERDLAARKVVEAAEAHSDAEDECDACDDGDSPEYETAWMKAQNARIALRSALAAYDAATKPEGGGT